MEEVKCTQAAERKRSKGWQIGGMWLLKRTRYRKESNIISETVTESVYEKLEVQETQKRSLEMVLLWHEQ